MGDQVNPTPEPKGSPPVIDKVRAGLRAFGQKAKEDFEALKKPEKTPLYKSMFRVKHDESERSRALSVLTNVFFHLHPAKVNRDAVRYGYGRLLRNMHRWAAHLMVIAVWLHMFRVFLTGSYKRPREFNWCVGVVLLVFTLLLSFTGYLLPDDQLGFWAVTVGTNMARATPLLGHEGPFGPQLGMTPYNDVRFALLGGSIVDANALLRAYIWHCLAIPIILSFLLAVHFWRVRKDGGISGPAPVQLESEIKPIRKI